MTAIGLSGAVVLVAGVGLLAARKLRRKAGQQPRETDALLGDDDSEYAFSG